MGQLLEDAYFWAITPKQDVEPEGKPPVDPEPITPAFETESLRDVTQKVKEDGEGATKGPESEKRGSAQQ